MSPTLKTTILLVCTSDIWNVSARSVLAPLPDFELLDTVHGGLTAYQTVLERQPHMLIIDNSLPVEEAEILITKLRAEACKTYCIWVVATARQKNLALANLVDAVILRSGSQQQLITAVLTARDHIKLANATTQPEVRQSPRKNT